MALETEKILVVSTVHGSPDDMEILNRLAWHQAGLAKDAHGMKDAFKYEAEPLEVHARGFGFLIRNDVYDDTDAEEMQQKNWEELKEEGFSPEFLSLIRFAQGKKYRWILLDADADEITGLPKGPWR